MIRFYHIEIGLIEIFLMIHGFLNKINFNRNSVLN